VTEKLEKIVENLDRQHGAVKKNMLFLIEKRAEDLVKKAKSELAAIGDTEVPHQQNVQAKQDIRSMIRRARVPMKEDADPGAYEIKADTFQTPEPSLLTSDDQDVEMADATPHTQSSIRAQVTLELRDLVMRGASEMERYETHAYETTKKYREALERRKGRAGPSTSLSGHSSAVPPRGILVNKNGERPADREAKKKTATFETHEDVAWRGSR
jgi:hypothetical protein